MTETLFTGSSLLVVAAALLFDHLLGEVPRWHPLVGFGRLAQGWERHLNHGGEIARFVKGAAGVMVLILPVIALLHAIELPSSLQWLWDAVVVYFCLGFRSLRDHTTPIANALQDLQGAAHEAEKALLNEAHTRTSWIVSRDADSLDAQQCGRAAVESLLENGNDALFATLFWAVLLGPAGAVAHRLVNTLDAMWGYRTARLEWFGKCAARADDVMAWLPARLTALSYCLAGNLVRGIRCWRLQAHQLKSPNGGPCMTAGAGSLGVILGGPARYHGEWVDKPYFGEGEPPTGHDIVRAQRLLWRALVIWLAVLAALIEVA